MHQLHARPSMKLLVAMIISIVVEKNPLYHLGFHHDMEFLQSSGFRASLGQDFFHVHLEEGKRPMLFALMQRLGLAPAMVTCLPRSPGE